MRMTQIHHRAELTVLMLPDPLYLFGGWDLGMKLAVPLLIKKNFHVIACTLRGKAREQTAYINGQ